MQVMTKEIVETMTESQALWLARSYERLIVWPHYRGAITNHPVVQCTHNVIITLPYII